PPTRGRIRRNQQDQAIAQLGRLLQGVPEPAAQLGADHHAVDHDLDVVLELLVEDDRIAEVADLTVHPGAGIALAAGLREDLAVLALAPLDHRRRHHQAGALGKGQNLIRDLLDGLLADLPTAAGAVWVPDPGVHQPEVVVNLGDRADRRARVLAGPLLV